MRGSGMWRDCTQMSTPPSGPCPWALVAKPAWAKKAWHNDSKLRQSIWASTRELQCLSRTVRPSSSSFSSSPEAADG